MTVTTDFTRDFEGCRTASQADAVYRQLFAQHIGEMSYPLPEAYQPLSEAHRRAMERLTLEAREDARPHDPNRVRPNELRNWLALQGIPLAKKGKVPVALENQYREAHDMPLLETSSPSEPRQPQRERTDSTTNRSGELDAKVVRAWAREQGIAVGTRGRLHPDVYAQYVAEFPQS